MKRKVTLSVSGMILLILASGGHAQVASGKNGPMAKVGFVRERITHEGSLRGKAAANEGVKIGKEAK